MDRRVVAGMVGVILAAHSQVSRAQVGPDPSGLPPVGLSTVSPLEEVINGSGTTRAPRSAVPTDPRASGPPAVLPLPPALPGPVSLTPEPPLNQSIRSGYRTGPISSMIRGFYPGAVRPAPPTPQPNPATLRYSATRSAAAAPPTAVPAPMSMPMPFPEIPPIEGFAPPAKPRGRPAPFAGQVPTAARRQADPAVSATAGRPAPLSAERPMSARPQTSAPITPTYHPAESPAPAPRQGPPEIVPVPDFSMPPPLTEGPPALTEGPPPLEPTPPSEASTTPPPLEALSAGASVPPSVEDPAVRRVSDEVTALRMKSEKPKDLPFATLRAAAVGDEVITIEELNEVVGNRLQELKGSAPTSERDKRQFINMIAAHSLDNMIDQAVILQEARRRMSNPKAQKMFDDFIDKRWREDELPPLLRKTNSANEYELKRRLTEQGKTYESLKEAFRKKVMAHEFLNSQIQNKVTCDLAEQRAFYNENIAKFEQPARFTWREVEISCAKHPSRAAARQAAEAALARLLRDEDFAAVAREVSHGPTASQGGVYPDMSPGSYGIPVVNDELNRLPIGQVSQILEAPNSFHIVRVESRREAGPLRFDEVQDKIKPMIMQQNYQRAVEAYLQKIRARTLIRTMFDNSESDPKLARQTDATVRPVSNR